MFLFFQWMETVDLRHHTDYVLEQTPRPRDNSEHSDKVQSGQVSRYSSLPLLTIHIFSCSLNSRTSAPAFGLASGLPYTGSQRDSNPGLKNGKPAPYRLCQSTAYLHYLILPILLYWYLYSQPTSHTRVVPLAKMADLIGDFRLVVWVNGATLSVQYNAVKVHFSCFYTVFMSIRSVGS